MTEAVQVAIIAAVPSFLGSVLLAWRARKQSRKVDSNIVQFQIQLNGRMEELLKTKIAEAFAAGRLHALEKELNRPRGKRRATDPAE